MRVIVLVVLCLGLSSSVIAQQQKIRKSANFNVDTSLNEPLVVEGTVTLPQTVNLHVGLVLVTGITGEYPNTWRISHHWLARLTAALNQMGITVFRYTSTDADPAKEAMAALTYLKSSTDLGLSKVGLLGHAQGGETIAVVAARTVKVDFLISLAGVATGEKVEQYIPKIRVPVLAISGNKDFILPAGPNLRNWKDLSQIGGNRRVRTAEFIGLNHYLSYCYTCQPEEYASRKQEVGPDVLREINRWLRQEVLAK